MIGLSTGDIGHSVREAVQGWINAHHDIAQVRALRQAPIDRVPVAWHRLADDGWLGARVPVMHGGSGLAARDVAAVADLFGKALVIEPFVAMGLLPTLVLVATGADESLRQAMSGGTRYALAWQENTGDVVVRDALTCRFRDGSVHGTKRFVSAGDLADHFLVAVRGDEGVILAIIDRDAPGLALTSERQLDGSGRATLVMRDVVPTAHVSVCPEAIDTALDEARVFIAVQLVGIAREALAVTIEYTKTRQQFGQPIGAFQALQHRMVDFASAIRLSEVACDAALRAIDDDETSREDVARLAAAAKASAAETAVAVTQGAIQLHGAIGYTDEADIGLYLTAALTLAPWLGSPDTMRDRFLDLGGASGDA